MNILKFKKLDEQAIIPKYQTKGAAGFDFHALIKDDNVTMDGQKGCIIILPNEQRAIRTGLAVSIPEGFQIEIRPRSGLAFKNCITITNAPATIDEDFVNMEILIILFNLGDRNFIVKNGDRIAQGILSYALKADIQEISDFSKEDLTRSRNGGFGSTGK